MFGYEYFCGANVVVEIEGLPILETAGISYQINEGKIPLYGYSSRHFDAVARGQVLVQGSLLVNFVHHDYLYQSIQIGFETQSLTGQPDTLAGRAKDELDGVLQSDPARNAILQSLFEKNNIVEFNGAVDAFKERFWVPDIEAGISLDPNISLSPSPHDSFGGLDIRVTFGERSDDNAASGITGYLLKDVYFLGRGNAVQIDEEVIVEEYSFFARNVYGIRQGYTITPAVANPTQDTQRGGAGDSDITVITGTL